MINIKKIREFLEKNKDSFEFIAAACTTIGIFLVAGGYSLQQRINREQKAFDLYQQFNTGQFKKDRDELTKAYYNMREKNPFYSDGNDYNSEMQSLWNEHRVSIISMTDFFEQVATCRKKGLCDEKTTEALFGKEATKFLETHYQFFCNERKKYGDKNIGEILEKLVEEINKEDNNRIVKFVKKTEKIDSQNSRNCDRIQKTQPREITS